MLITSFLEFYLFVLSPIKIGASSGEKTFRSGLIINKIKSAIVVRSISNQYLNGSIHISFACSIDQKFRHNSKILLRLE